MKPINPWQVLLAVALGVILVLLFVQPPQEPRECPKFEIQYDKRPGRALT